MKALVKKPLGIGILALLSAFVLSLTLFCANAFADADSETVNETSVTKEITAHFTGTGTIIAPATQFTNNTKYPMTLSSANMSNTYSWTSDWTNDGAGKTIAPNETLTINWTCPSKIPSDKASEFVNQRVELGSITYNYSYAIPNLPGNVVINGTAEVGQTLTANVFDTPKDISLNYVWYRGDTEGATTTQVGTGPTYTVSNGDNGMYLTCVVTDATGYYANSISSSTKVKLDAFAVYSADDNSLNFYKRKGMPSTGDTFNGKTATAVYTGIEKDTYSPSSAPWSNYRSIIASSTVIDDDISPVSTTYWFSNCSSLSSLDLSKLDTSNVTNMGSMFSSCKSLTSVDLSGWNTSNITNMNYMFRNCNKLTSVGDLSNWDTRKVTNMSNMFSSCKSLTSVGDLSNWDTSKVTNMNDMFYQCFELTSIGDLSGWNTSKVVYMSEMFASCTSLTSLDLSGWNTSNVTKMDSMFSNSRTLTSVGDLSNWDTSSVRDMSAMFWSCFELTSIGNLSGWDTSNVTDMGSMFSNSRTLTSLDLSGWDTSNVTKMGSMFQNCTKLQEVTFGADWKWVGTNGYLPTPSSTYITGADGKWYDTDGNGYAPDDIPSNKAMTYTAIVPKKAFAVYSADDNSLNFYKRTSVPSAGDTFNGKTATAVYTGIEKDDYSPSSVPWSNYRSSIISSTVVDDGIAPVSTAYWFNRCTSLTSADLSKLDTSNVTDMSWMFYNCYSLTSVNGISQWDTSNVTDMSWMFYNCQKPTSVDLSSWNTSKVTNMNNMFEFCTSLTSLNLSGWDTSNVTNMNSMFSACRSITSIGDLSGWNTSKVTGMESMFSNCNSLTSLDLSKLDTSNVADMSWMFNYCESLASVNLSKLDTSKVADMSSMFRGCTSLTSLDLSGWNTSNVTNMSSMFYSCSKLTLNCSTWNVAKVTKYDNFNNNAPGVIAPAWASSDEVSDEDSIAPLSEETKTEGESIESTKQGDSGVEESATKPTEDGTSSDYVVAAIVDSEPVDPTEEKDSNAQAA